MFRRYIEGPKLMDTVKTICPGCISEIQDKYPERVLSDIDAGNFLFTDGFSLPSCSSGDFGQRESYYLIPPTIPKLKKSGGPMWTAAS